MNDKLVKQIGKLLENQTTLLREEMRESEERIKSELKGAIRESQADTIEALTELMNSGYENHETRLKTIEKQLNIPQSQ